ncbi:MAG TPA: EamA family transporter, partial [Actinomycetota bacterium]|nr:EamA family transporter [Actinomycetota bacterium]
MNAQPSMGITEAPRPDRSTLLAFSATVLIGGLNFLLVKFSNEELPPIYGAGVRFGLGGLVFLGIALARKMALPRGRALAGAAVYGLLNFGVGYALVYFALTRLQVGTTSVIMALVPLLTLVFAVFHGQERFTGRGVAGALLALAGITMLSLRSLGADAPALYLLAVFGGACAAAESTVLVKGFPRAHPVTTNAAGMGAASLLLFAISVGFGESWVLPRTGRTWLVVAWLVVVGSVGLFGLVVFVIRRWTASAAVYALTLMPVVAVVAGSLFAGDHCNHRHQGQGVNRGRGGPAPDHEDDQAEQPHRT